MMKSSGTTLPSMKRCSVKRSKISSFSPPVIHCAISSVTAGAILKAARGADKALIRDVVVFDVFEGNHVGEGKKSIAIEVTLQPSDRTLTDEEIDKVSAGIIAAVTKTSGGVLRT